jgi:uncharacterized RDD family membrane protein YckC
MNEAEAEKEHITPSYGGFWKRGLAYLIDVIIISIPVTLLFGSGISLGVNEQTPGTYNVHLNMDMTMPEFVIVLISWIYFAGLESSAWQATIGKHLLGMQITDLDGQRISFLRATGRYLAKFLSSALLMIGFIMIAFTARKQGLHDMIAGTLVINQRN